MGEGPTVGVSVGGGGLVKKKLSTSADTFEKLNSLTVEGQRS